MVYHSLFKVDTQNVGILWYDTVEQEGESGSGLTAASEEEETKSATVVRTQRVLRTSIYNMIHNTWRTIRLVSFDIAREPSFRFGATIVPIFDKHVAMREQIETAQQI